MCLLLQVKTYALGGNSVDRWKLHLLWWVFKFESLIFHDLILVFWLAIVLAWKTAHRANIQRGFSSVMAGVSFSLTGISLFMARFSSIIAQFRSNMAGFSSVLRHGAHGSYCWLEWLKFLPTWNSSACKQSWQQQHQCYTSSVQQIELRFDHVLCHRTYIQLDKPQRR